MSEVTQEGPKWLKELEEKREKRLKARLGHEAGAGSPCLSCEEKCPGLDLHFWRKICKNCKCGKENHDVNDDDIYGWAQFQLLGSKPNKAKKFVIPGRKDAVDLEWMPKGQNDVVESYLKDLPLNLLPIKGSVAAQERKQLLQKQIPLHDIDPTLCHALSENEIKQMNDYVAHVKQSSVGVGHIMKLNELLKNRRSANAQILASRSPMQLPQVQNIVLQGVDRANLLKLNPGEVDLHKGLRDLNIDEQKLYNISQDERAMSNASNIRDVVYDVYARDKSTNGNSVLNASELEVGIAGIPQNMQVPKQPVANQIDYKNYTNVGAVHDINYPNHNRNLHNKTGSVLNQANNVLIPHQPIQSCVDYQTATNLGDIRDVHYSTVNQNVDPKLGNVQIPHQPIYNQIDYQNPNFGAIKDLHYDPSINQTADDIKSQNLKNLPHYAKNSLINIENTQRPIDYANMHNVYPDMNVNFESADLKANPELLDNVLCLKGDPNMPHYAPSKFNTFVEQQNPQKIGNVKDLAYSTYDPYSNKNLNNTVHGGFDPIHSLKHETVESGGPYGLEQSGYNLDPSIKNYDSKRVPDQSSLKNIPANYNPHELNVMEQNLNPTSVNVGIINDIEYPTIKSAVQRQNDIFEQDLPRKNVHFDLSQNSEILPSCHRCKKMFDTTAIVIGTDRTDALWHADCFKCAGCSQNLADLMYFYHKESDDIYCGRDYAKIRGIPRCQACDELIFVKEYCLAENSTFHVKHFCCFECDEPLAGQNYVMEDSQPLCLPCFEKVKAEKCNTCLKVIKPDEQGANLNGVHFHADDNCFACKMCKKPLLGAKLLFKNQNLYCSALCFNADK